MHGLCLVYLLNAWTSCTFYLSHYQIQGEQIQHKMSHVIPAQRRLSADSCQNRAVLLTLLCVASLWASCLLDLKTGETDSKKCHVSYLCVCVSPLKQMCAVFTSMKIYFRFPLVDVIIPQCTLKSR